MLQRKIIQIQTKRKGIFKDNSSKSEKQHNFESFTYGPCSFYGTEIHCYDFQPKGPVKLSFFVI